MEQELVKAVLANEALIALTGYDRAARNTVLDRAEAQLSQQACRIVRLRAVDGQPINLKSAMDQVVGAGPGGADRVERFFDTIALPVGEERHIVLMIEEAHQIGSDLTSYLALIGPTTVGQDLRLQMVFAGDPIMWDRLPKSGNLAADAFTSRIVLYPPTPHPSEIVLPSRMAPVAHVKPPPSVPDFSTQFQRAVDREPPPTYGYEDLRQRLALDQRRRQHVEMFTSRVVGTALSMVLCCALIGAGYAVWTKMPELRETVRHWVTASAGPTTHTETPSVAALVARGNWLLSKGDIGAARAVFENAALTGSPSAVTGLAKANDPRYLSDIGAHNVSSDATLAIGLYQRAVALGDREAADRLSRLQSTMRR